MEIKRLGYSAFFMPKRLYLDSNVFISFVREEIDSAFNLRFLDSENFFAVCKNKKHVLLISNWFLSEVGKIACLDKKAISEEFERHGVNAIFIQEKIDFSSVSRIAKQTGLHYADALHVSIALENKADFIVTWNIRDFEKASALIKAVSPNEILDTL